MFATQLVRCVGTARCRRVDSASVGTLCRYFQPASPSKRAMLQVMKDYMSLQKRLKSAFNDQLRIENNGADDAFDFQVTFHILPKDVCDACPSRSPSPHQGPYAFGKYSFCASDFSTYPGGGPTVRCVDMSVDEDLSDRHVQLHDEHVPPQHQLRRE